MSALRPDDPRMPGVIEGRLAALAPASGFTLWSDAPAFDAIIELLARTARRLKIAISAAPVAGGLRIRRSA